MQYIKEKIGFEYKNWVNRNVILISAQTGSGKTSFILRTLLPFAKENGKHILYFVNRSILKEQLEEELLYYPIEEKTYIQLETYQHIEKKLSGMQSDDEYIYFCKKYQKYDYIVCDEAHYFSSDSNFNTYTNLSYNWIRWMFYKKIRIFISATLDLVESRICSDVNNELFVHDAFYDLIWYKQHTSDFLNYRNYIVKKYDSERDYSYFPCPNIVNLDELPQLIKKGKGKWLIFVDDICLGEKLKKDIEDKIKERNNKNSSDVILLTAEYNKNQESFNTVNEIAQTMCQSAKVLICTSVMENGVSIKDNTVKNIVIGIDVEDQFIQMIGRKRIDTSEKVNLFLLKKSKEQIVNRLNEVKKAKELSNKCGSKIIELKNYIQNLDFEHIHTVTNNIILYKKLYWAFSNFYKNMKAGNDGSAWDKLQCDFYKYLYSEIDAIARNSFMNNNDSSWKIFYLYNNLYYVNLFSMDRIEYLCKYYKKLIDEFDKYGDLALVRRQLLWMGKSEEQANQSIEEIGSSLFEISRNKIITKFEEIAGRKMTGDEWKDIINGLKKEFNDLFDFSDVDNSKEWEDVKKSVLKTDRILSIDKMKKIKGPFNLPFTLKKERDKETNKDIFYLVKDE